MNPYEKIIESRQTHLMQGSDLFRIFGYTDIRNPIFSFDIMNDSNFRVIEDCIKNHREIPEYCNPNVVRLRDYRLGGMINAFRELCDSALNFYEEAWEEYRNEYNPEMPETFYDFWLLYDHVIFEKILPKYINLIDPISMTWIDPEYPKATLKDDVYQYTRNEPLMTYDTTFLRPKSEMEYHGYDAHPDPLISIYDTLHEEVQELVPDSIVNVEILNNELTNTEPKNRETEAEFIRRTKFEVRAWRKKKRRFTTTGADRS